MEKTLISANLLKKYPITKSVFDYLNSNYLLYSKTYHFVTETFDEEYLLFAEELLGLLAEKLGSEKTDLTKSIEAFMKYSHEYLVLQTKLSRTGSYLYSSFDEVNKAVYQHKRMDEYYLDGLLLSQVLWPNHYRIARYFLGCSDLTRSSSSILDVPSGTGIYSYLVAGHFRYKRLCAVDISPYAKAYAERVLRKFLPDSSNISIEVADVYDLKEEQEYDLIVCGELLEHVEQPGKLLQKLRTLLREDGWLFLTTAIYTAAIDHIYLFRNVPEVRALLGDYFSIKSELVLPVSLEGYAGNMNMVPINYACFLEK